MLIRPYRDLEDSAALGVLLAECCAAGDIDPLSEAKRLAVGTQGTSLVAYDATAIAGFGQLLAYPGNGTDPGTALPSHPTSRWEGEFVVAPRRRRDLARPMAVAVTAAAVSGSVVEMWAAEVYQTEALSGLGWQSYRSLDRMEISPVPDAHTSPPPGIRISSFLQGRDEAAFLRANRAAFAGHPEQASWGEATLAARMELPWFDAAGFLLAWRGPEVVGFCWTKVHNGESAIGEIYLIGVIPAAQGVGLGRTLTAAGLRHLAGQRGVPRAMLYVNAENGSAHAMYRRMGFEVTATKVVYRMPPEAREAQPNV